MNAFCFSPLDADRQLWLDDESEGMSDRKLLSDRLVFQVATAINDAYRVHYKDSLSIVTSIEMANAAIKVLQENMIGNSLSDDPST